MNINESNSQLEDGRIYTKYATKESGYELASNSSSLITQKPLDRRRLYSVCSVNVYIDRISSAGYTANLVTAAAEMRPSGRGRHTCDFVRRVKKHFNTVSFAWFSICLGPGHEEQVLHDFKVYEIPRDSQQG